MSIIIYENDQDTQIILHTCTNHNIKYANAIAVKIPFKHYNSVVLVKSTKILKYSKFLPNYDAPVLVCVLPCALGGRSDITQ